MTETSVSLEEARTKLPELIHALLPGRELVITEGNQEVARIIPTQPIAPQEFGSLRLGLTSSAMESDSALEDLTQFLDGRPRGVFEVFLLARARARALVRLLKATSHI